MEELDKANEVLLSIQDKHFEYFFSTQTIITDHVEIISLPVLKISIKPTLPKHIADDINRFF